MEELLTREDKSFFFPFLFLNFFLFLFPSFWLALLAFAGQNEGKKEEKRK